MSKDMIITKLSRTVENVQDVQTNSNPPAKEPPLWDIMSEL